LLYWPCRLEEYTCSRSGRSNPTQILPQGQNEPEALLLLRPYVAQHRRHCHEAESHSQNGVLDDHRVQRPLAPARANVHAVCPHRLHVLCGRASIFGFGSRKTSILLHSWAAQPAQGGAVQRGLCTNRKPHVPPGGCGCLHAPEPPNRTTFDGLSERDLGE
jgi:hypothetical protein